MKTHTKLLMTAILSSVALVSLNANATSTSSSNVAGTGVPTFNNINNTIANADQFVNDEIGCYLNNQNVVLGLSYNSIGGMTTPIGADTPLPTTNSTLNITANLSNVAKDSLTESLAVTTKGATWTANADITIIGDPCFGQNSASASSPTAQAMVNKAKPGKVTKYSYQVSSNGESLTAKKK